MFEQISHGNEQVSAQAFAVVRAAAQGLRRPWSFCELTLSATDYDWLVEWARLRRPSEVRDAQTGWKMVDLPNLGRRERCGVVFGVLLFALEAEQARREAREDAIWPCLVRLPWSREVHELLFLRHGQPNAAHKALLRQAAEAIGLRHVFGVEGTQNWFNSLYLQFGFTHHGLCHRLPAWLAGQPMTLAGQWLLGDPALKSPSFEEFWNTLQGVARGNRALGHARRVLEASRWLLPDWIDEILAKAQERWEGWAGEYLSDGEPGALEFLATPRLVWATGADPQFKTELCNLAACPLEPEHTGVIWLGNRKIGSVWKDEMGETQHNAPLKIPVPWDQSSHLAQIEQDNGRIIASQTLQLWNGNEDIQLVRLSTGASETSSARFVCGVGFILLIPHEFRTETENPHLSCHLPSAGLQAERFDDGWSGPIRVLMGEEEIWSSDTLGSQAATTPDQSVTFQWQGQPLDVGRLGTQAEFQVRTGYGVRLRWLRRDAQPLSPDSQNRVHLLLSADDLFNPPTIRAGIEHDGRKAVVRVRVNVRFRGAIARPVDGAVYSLHTNQPLLAVDAQRQKIRLGWEDPDGHPDSDASLKEGNALLSRWKPETMRTIGAVHGYGAPLQLSKAGRMLIEIAGQVLDGGIVRNWAPGANPLRIKLTQSIEPSADHWLLFGMTLQGGTRRWVVTSDIEPVGQIAWQTPNPCRQGEFIQMVGMGYRSSWLGSRFDLTRWTHLLNGSWIDDDARELGRALRWLKAPLLGPHLRRVQSWLAEHWWLVLPEWLRKDDAGAFGRMLRFSEPDEDWLGALGEVFSEMSYKCDPPNVAAMLDALPELAGLGFADRLHSAAAALVRVCPVLAARVVTTSLRGSGASRAEQQSRLRQIADTLELNEEEKQGLFRSLAGGIGQVDERFVLSNCPFVKPHGDIDLPAGRQLEHYRVALWQPAFRRLTAAKLLREKAQRP